MSPLGLERDNTVSWRRLVTRRLQGCSPVRNSDTTCSGFLPADTSTHGQAISGGDGNGEAQARTAAKAAIGKIDARAGLRLALGMVGPSTEAGSGDVLGERWASTSAHTKAVNEMKQVDVGGGHHLKEICVLQVQGKCKTDLGAEVLLKRQEHIRREPRPWDRTCPVERMAGSWPVHAAKG